MSYRLIATVAAAIVTAAPFAASAADKPTTFKFLTAWDNRQEATPLIAYRYGEMLTKASNGNMKFKFSGPEVVKFKQQMEPTRRGVFDLNMSVAPYYFGTTSVPMAYFALPADTELWRKRGYWQYSAKEFERFGLKLLVHAVGGSTDKMFHLMLKEPVDKSPTPLKGRKVRGNIFYKPVIEPLGGSIVTLSGAEIYSAIQKGVVEGAAWPVSGAISFKWYEVAKYMTRPRFGVSPYQVFMNLSKFKKLSKADQDMLLKVGRQLENEVPKIFDASMAKEIADLKKRGVKETYLGAEAAAKIEKGFRAGVWRLAKLNKTSTKRGEELHTLAKKYGDAQ